MLNAREMQESIVFFDGVCTLCNHFVDWLLRHDSRAVFKVASLQGETAKKYLSEEQRTKLNSLALSENGQIYTKSTAVLKISAKLGAPWSYFKVFLWLPRPLRDWTYDLVAKHRYSLFGKKERCRIPTPAEKARFLD